MKRVTVIGGSGLIGRAMTRHLTSKGLPLAAPRSSRYDATRREDLERLVDDTRPEVLINCAGHIGRPNVDACEDQKPECLRLNALLPELIREVCVEKGILFAHVSSGCLFSGRRPDGGGFRESDPPNFSFRQDNCSFYSGSKAMGEELLGYRAVAGDDGTVAWSNPSPDCHVWRLRIPFDDVDGPRNYLSKVMTYETLLEVENSMTRLADFASGCWQLIERSAPPGLYHLTNPGAITTSGVTEIIRRVGRELEAEGGHNPFPVDFRFFEDEARFMATAARAPRSHCVLDTGKVEALGIHLPPLEEAIIDCLRNWKTPPPRPTGS